MKIVLPRQTHLLVFLVFIKVLAGTRSLQAQDNVSTTLTGTVIDLKTRQVLQGATISIGGSTNEVLTDENGAFKVSTYKKLPVTLIVSYVGYQKKEFIALSASGSIIELQESIEQLNDVVVVSTGYSSQSKKTYTGSAVKIRNAQLKNRPAQSFDQLLGGQAAGVDIIQPSGVLNNAPTFRIRGLNSISSGLTPLIIVDGVAVFTGLVGGAIGNNPLSDINPSDIESIDILKDASATAIYGSRAANGVVIINTIKGKQGKAKVDYNGWVSASRPFNLPPLLGARDYVTIKNEAMTNANQTPGFALQTLEDGTIVDTDWYDVAYRTGISQNHDVSISGATPYTKYYLSVGYSDQNGILKRNSFDRKSVRLNLDHQLLKSVNIGTNVTFSNSLNSGPHTGSLPGQYLGTDGIARLLNILPPNVAVYNPDGTYNIQDNVRVGYGANISNPSTPGYVGIFNAYNAQLILDKNTYTSESNTLIGNVYAEWNLLAGLKLKTSYGLNHLNVENTEFLNPVHGGAATAGGRATNVASKFKRSDWVTTLNYTKTFFDKHELNVLAGYEEIYTTVNGWGAARTGITDPSYTSYQGGWANINPTGTNQSENGFVSYFSNLNYNYDRRYLLSASFRRDGYSGLAEGRKFGNFVGASAGWNITEEKFFQNSSLSSLISNLKIRGSYGQVGNIDIGDFPSLSLYGSGTYAGISSLGLSQAGNTNLRWEKSTKTDVGLNLSFLQGALSIEADYYKSVIDGIILDARQAPSRGIPGSSIKSNVGSMYNQGIELGINAALIQRESFSWNSSLNFSTLKNRVTVLSDGNDIYVPSNFGIQNMTREGYSVGSIWAVPTTGVNPSNGYRVYLNNAGEQVQYNHAGTPRWTYVKDGSAAPAIDNYLDGKILGSSLPTYYGGFNNNFVHQDFDLGINFTFSGGNKIYNGTRANLMDQRYFNNGPFIMDRWTTPGQITDIPKPVYGDNISSGFVITNSALVEDGSYLKLKNVSAGYRLPVRRLTGNKISSARVYIQASNLFVITNYTGSDPEISIHGNSIQSGKDHNTVVNARVFTFGLNLGF